MSKKNLKVIVCCGIPGSGKSTYAQKFVEENDKYIRVNRDDFRHLLKNKYVVDYKVEELITTLCNNAIISALNANFNIIIDNTHLKEKYINQVKELVKYKADVEFMVFDVPLETAIERDLQRSRIVGESVIKRMYEDFVNLKKNFNFESVLKQNKFYGGKIKESDLEKAIIVDLDGTLAYNNDNRRHHYDWENTHLDDCNFFMKREIEAHKLQGSKIIILSARDGAAENSTKTFLSKNEIPYDILLLKGVNDNRKDTVVKRELYETYVKNKYNVIAVFDDKKSIVDMFRSMDLNVYHVNNHEF